MASPSCWCSQVILKGDTKKLSLHGVRREIYLHFLIKCVINIEFSLFFPVCDLKAAMRVLF